MYRSHKAGASPLILAFAMMAALLLAVTGCGGNSPGSASAEMVDKLSTRSFGEAYDSFATQSQMRAELTREQFIAQFEAALPPGSEIVDFSVTEEKTDGDRATVTWKATVKVPNAEDQPLDDQFELIREDGVWKVDK